MSSLDGDIFRFLMFERCERMTKILTTLNQLNDYEKLKDFCDGFLLGINGLSIEYPSYQKEELLNFLPTLKKDKKEIFLALNKNMHNEDLTKLEEIMKIFDTKVDGFLYYDVALVELKQKHHFKTPLVWGQEHLTTNYLTSNYWYSFGASYTFLSSEITLEEIIEIKENAKAKLIVPIFGRLPMFVSNRHLVQNYYHYFEKNYEKGNYHMEKEGKSYPIIDSDLGTTVYSGHYLNGLKESLMLKKKNIDYFYCNPFDIDSSTFSKILECFYTVTEENWKEKEEQIENLLESNTDKGFLYKETVYKVK